MDDVQPVDLAKRRDRGEDVFVLDVREDEEVAEWAFPGAHHIPMGQIGDRTDEQPTDRPIVVVCHSGMRSARVATALEQAGWPAANLAGGAVAWIEAMGDVHGGDPSPGLG